MKNKDCPEFENSVFCMLGTSSVRYLVGKLYSMLKMPQKFIFEGQNNKKNGIFHYLHFICLFAQIKMNFICLFANNKNCK